MGSSAVEVSSLTKGFTEGEYRRNVLDGLDLTLENKEMTVLLGRSGSGKSTLLNLISGIDLPDRGEVKVGPVNLTALSEYERTCFRRKHIGFVFQSYNLIPTLTVEENVLLPLELNEITAKKDYEHAMYYLNEVGLIERRNTFPDRLSGGEQQRVAIARALAHSPTLILADEPTGNLDYETGLKVQELLERLVRESGRTMIIGTHDHELCEMADRSWLLQGGKLQTYHYQKSDKSRP